MRTSKKVKKNCVVPTNLYIFAAQEIIIKLNTYISSSCDFLLDER